MSMRMQPQPEPQRSYEPTPAADNRKLEEQRRAEEEAERARAEQRERQEQQRRDDLQRKVLEEQRRRELVNRYKDELLAAVEQALKDMGYNPPDPSPFLRIRTLECLGHAQGHDVTRGEALSLATSQVERQFAASVAFAGALQKSIVGAGSMMTWAKTLIGKIHPAIPRATLSLQPPETSVEVQERMHAIERFLVDPWGTSPGHGILSIHRDEAKRQTIVQIGIGVHGPLYIKIPGLLAPPDLAEASLRALIGRLAPFTTGVDPLAVVNGAHQHINFNQLFQPGRVIRAPSGDTARLSLNFAETRGRERLSPDNTVVFNSTPASVEEYTRVFPDDGDARHWDAWAREAGLWNDASSGPGFAPATESSREALLAALTQRKNVIVVVAHCDGQELFMPDPPPSGTQVSAQYLLEHRTEIAANRPFVYLFSCEAGDLRNLGNFASSLLEAGAAGVVASQRTVGSAEGRSLLRRILDERRGAPPIEDFWTAMRDTNYLDMEVFLA